MPITPTDLSVVEKLAEEHRANRRWELPQLVEETSWLDRLKEKLWNWFVSLFPDKKIESNFNFANLFELAIFILKIFIILAVITAVVWLIRTLIKAYRKKNAPFPVASSGGGIEIPTIWEEELAKALCEKNLSAAARVRWRICLRRISRPSSLTPAEFFGGRPALRETLPGIYELMFFHPLSLTTETATDRFEQWTKLLETEESSP